jgi:zinc transporter ZupT
MGGLCLHSFLEGMPLVQAGEGSGALAGGIILHHIPVAMALTGMLLDSSISRMQTVVWLVVFSAMAPAGAMFSQLLGDLTARDLSMYYHRMMAVVIGIFLHISTTILFENDEGHRFNVYKVGIMLLGAGVAYMM